MEEPHKRPDFSNLVVTISLILEAVAGYMNLSPTSLSIFDANKDEHQVAPLAKKASINSSHVEDEPPIGTEEIKACDPGMETQSKEGAS